jgi:hypothetical protein
MADSTTSLDRIAALVDKLNPVAQKQRGMRIEADDWNTLASVLLGVLQLDRLQEQRTGNLLEQRFAAKDHEHLGEVSIAWLDAALQAQTGGAAAPVATRQALAEMDQKIQSLTAEVARLASAFESTQKVLDDTLVKEADKSKTLLDFDRRFKGVEDLRTSVTTLAADVGSVRANVDKVLDLRKTLQDAAGNPIDVGQMRKDLTDLQSFRENLNGVDGKPLRLRDIEVKIQEISDVVGTGGAGGLDGRLATLSASIQEAVNAKTLVLVNDAQNALRAEASASETRLRSEIQTASAQTRDGLQQQFTAQIGATETKFNGALDTRLGALTEDVRKDALDNTTALLNQRLAEVPDQVRSQVAAAVNTLQATVSGNLQATLSAAVTAQVKDAESRLNQQITAVQASTSALTQSLPGLIANQVAGTLPGVEATLAQNVSAQVAAARQGIEATLNTTVSSAVSSSLQNLDARIATAVGQQTATLPEKINAAVTAATKNLPDQVAGEVRLQLSAANVDGKLQDSANALTTQLRSELKSAIADQDARASAAVQGAVTLLQGQMASAVAAGVQEAKDFSASQSANLRTELNATMDTKIKNSRDAIVTDFNSRLQASHDQLSADFTNQIRATNENFSTQIRNIQTRPGGLGPGNVVIR